MIQRNDYFMRRMIIRTSCSFPPSAITVAQPFPFTTMTQSTITSSVSSVFFHQGTHKVYDVSNEQAK